jgi:hypothetical protein
MLRYDANTLLLFLSFLLWNGPARGGAKEFVLSRGKAGPIETGMTVDQVFASVGRKSARLVDQQIEGFSSPALEIYLTKNQRTRPSLVAEIVGHDRIGRINVYDSRFKTEKGIGVGSTLGEIRREYRVDWIGFGEGPLCARVEQIGMTFALDYSKPPREWYETNNPALIPDGAKVVSILLASANDLGYRSVANPHDSISAKLMRRIALDHPRQVANLRKRA